MSEINTTDIPGNLSNGKTTLLKSFIDFIKKNSKFYLIYGNVVVITIVLYVIFTPVLAANYSSFESTVIPQIGYSIFYSCLVLVYPYFGMYKKEIRNPKKFILYMFLAMIIATIILDRLNIFWISENFNFIWHYGHDYLYGVKSVITAEYNPFIAEWYFVFVYITTPGESALIYRLITNCWGVGIYYMVYKISTIKNLGIDRNKLANTFIYITLCGIQLIFLLLVSKHDFFEIFISLIGIYFTLQKRWFLSAFILVFCGFFKIYPFFWIAGMLIVLIKQKKWSNFLKFASSVIITGVIFLALEIVVEGDLLIRTILEFRWQFLEEPVLYNLNWGYYLQFLNVPGLNILPSVLLICFLLFYTIKFAKEIDLNFFINVGLIVLIFYSAVSYQYLIWTIPLIGLTFMNNKSQYRKAIFVYEVIAVNFEFLAYSWMMLSGYTAYLNITTYASLVSQKLDYGKWLVVLVVQFIIDVPINVGFYLFMVIKSSSKSQLGFLHRLKLVKTEADQ